MAAFVDLLTEPNQWTDHAATSGKTVHNPIYDPPPFRPDPHSSQRLRDHRLTLLNRVVETEVLPRLVLAQRSERLRRNALRPAATEVAELMHLLLTQDLTCILAFIERLQAAGATPESLYLGVMTDAARGLHDLQQADQADFVQLSIANGYLQQLVRTLAPAFQTAAITRTTPASVMLAAAPGEQHTFGLTLLRQFFHRAGWQVAGTPSNATVGLLDTVRQSWIDVAAFWIGSDKALGALARLIRQTRRASLNPCLHIMVGGPLHLARPRLALRVNADTAAADARAAVHLANDMLAMRVAAE
jgi:MerR family transcriptional regulator, light-induced transcriptional regulator